MSKHGTILKSGLALLAFAVCVCLTPSPALACSACFGQDSGPLARGMNWGIFTLLLIVVCVLAAISSFFIFLAHKAASTPATPALPTSTESPSKQ